MTDVYAYWRSALAGKPDDALRLPTIGAHNGEDPQPGLWKVSHRKGSPKVPMQVWLVDSVGKPAGRWREGLRLAANIGWEAAGEQEIVDRWLFAKPCSKADVAYWREHGRWPADPDPLPPRSHNMPADPFQALTAEVQDRIAQAQQWLTVNSPIGDQVACDKARNMQAALLALLKTADGMHETEKRPHLEAGRAVDRRYGFRETIKDWSAKLRTVFEQFLRAEERRQQEEAARKHREEVARVEAERARIEAERARKLKEDPVGALTDPEPELPELPLVPEPVKVQAGGGLGRKAGLKTGWAFEITDYKLAALHVIEQPDVSAAVGKVIARMVRASKGRIEIPGVKVREERIVA